MIYKAGNGTAAIAKGTVQKQAVWWGAVLKWQNVRSCYGRGYWIEDKPWIDTDTWKDNR